MSLLRDHLDGLYRTDARGRLIAVNQWDGGPVPRLHLCRSTDGNHWRVRADLEEPTVLALDTLCRAEPALGDPLRDPDLAGDAIRLLEARSPIEAIWHGPAFAFPATLPASETSGVVAITPANASLLRALLPDWLPDVPHRQPFLAALVDGHVVTVCASVRITPAVHAAGVETHPDFRGRGLARRVVRAWAAVVRRLGAAPVYSTSWENAASQAVARSLDLELIGTDYHLR